MNSKTIALMTGVSIAIASTSSLAFKLPGLGEVLSPTPTEQGKDTPAPKTAPVRNAKNPIEGRYIVVLSNSSGPVGTLANSLLAPFGLKPDLVFSKALKGFAVNMTPNQASQIAAASGVRYVEQDAVVKKSETPWGLDRIDQAKLPLDGKFTPSSEASNVSAYIIDTGIRASHEEFKGRVGEGYNVAGASDGMFNILGPIGKILGGLLGGGGNEKPDPSDPTDCNGHGTHVAGTVAGSQYGIARGATIHAVRVLDCKGSGSTSGVIEGVEWVTKNAKKPAVVNMSLGGGASSALDEAVANSIKSGLFYAVAAGNEDADACGSSPARVDSAFTVGSTDKTDKRSSFSNKGKCVDIFAPGTDIISAWYDSDRASKTISGTSMASPHAAGVAALYLADHPDASPKQVMDALTKISVQDVVNNPANGSPNRLLQEPKKKAPVTSPAPTKAPAKPTAQPPAQPAPPGAAPGTNPDATPGATPAPSPTPSAPQKDLGGISFWSQCEALTCRFSSLSKDANPTYLWDFGDQTQSTEAEPSHFFPSAEDFQVKLQVSSAQGQRSAGFSLEVGTANAPCSDCQAAQGVIQSGDNISLPSITTDNERDISAWLKGKEGSYHRLVLQRKNNSGWDTVSQSYGGDENQVLVHNDAAPGQYRFRISTGSDGKPFKFWSRLK